MPDLPAPEIPAEQVALRATVEDVLREYAGAASYSHSDRFWEADNRREVIYGWGTKIEARTTGDPFDVWFDGLDRDIVVYQGGPWRRQRGQVGYHEWQDLTDLDTVLAEVTRVLRTLLSAYR